MVENDYENTYGEKYDDSVKKVVDLSKNNAKLLFWKAVDELKHREVGYRIEESEDFVGRLSKLLYEELGLPTDMRDKKTEDWKKFKNYGSILLKFRDSIEEIEEDWAPERFEPPPLDPDDTQPIRPRINDQDPPNPITGIIIGAVILVFIACFCLSLPFLRQTFFPPKPTPTITPFPTNTPLPPTPTFTPTQTPTNTPTPTITFTPSMTPTHTYTPTPSITPTPTPNLILFEDNFDFGVSSEWRIQTGNPISVNGQLSATTETWLLVGDPSWTDYEIQFDLEYEIMGSVSKGIVGVRAQDTYTMNAFFWRTIYSVWETWRTGEVYRIDQSKTGGIGYPPRHFIITVRGDLFIADTGNVVTSFINSDLPTGFVAIRLNEHMLFDNFVIKRIP